MDSTRLVMLAVTLALIGWALAILVKVLTPSKRRRPDKPPRPD